MYATPWSPLKPVMNCQNAQRRHKDAFSLY